MVRLLTEQPFRSNSHMDKITNYEQAVVFEMQI
jgi:hypothetical protein